MRCPPCPVAADKTCLGDAHPEAFAHLCRWATSDVPTERTMPVLRSEIGYTPPPAPPPRAEPAAGHVLPLAGDIVAGLTEAIGVDRLAKWAAKQLTGVPDCGCARRRDALNRLDLKARLLLERLRSRIKDVDS